MKIETTVELGGCSFNIHTISSGPDGAYTPDSDLNNDLVSYDIRRYGSWEPYQSELTLELLRTLPNKVFIDIGAHIGYYSIIAAKHGFDVIAFEKNPVYFKVLADNAAPYSNIQLLRTEVTRDNLPKFEKPVGLIKIDVEGCEPEIIAGMEDIITARLIDALIVEISPKFRPPEVWLELITFMIENGYSAFDIGLSPPRAIQKKTCHLEALIPFDVSTLQSIDQTNVLFLLKDAVQPLPTL
jgi:hypothetical protein